MRILTNPKYEEKLFYLVGDIFKNKVYKLILQTTII